MREWLELVHEEFFHDLEIAMNGVARELSANGEQCEHYNDIFISKYD